VLVPTLLSQVLQLPFKQAVFLQDTLLFLSLNVLAIALLLVLVLVVLVKNVKMELVLTSMYVLPPLLAL